MNTTRTRNEAAKSEDTGQDVCSHCGWVVGNHGKPAEQPRRVKAKYHIIM